MMSTMKVRYRGDIGDSVPTRRSRFFKSFSIFSLAADLSPQKNIKGGEVVSVKKEQKYH